ncbi:class I SAM-dependent methyltransferase [Bifidobacterium sp.]|jgi:cyclopropane-fatty-acyl-phospholipid synthase|uniref:class I SAM-dependent methyltransferase n=1 Tax=Bifidobacterium sp. TaxID=41200 RepID=UPI0025C6A620|nr:class I SAM-dependent methyltransferase [Bifidobacterium sp.]MCH4160689.1 class I SAM-dependent methyltransferase [Bifidobacterium sp.]MCH4174886.1 class I SAM-dependent methyltransferase [Bifidobacterium sp.]MCI1634954.1 class I SAM-dependent methyltransferase [Bifidobacterium sp.]
MAISTMTVADMVGVFFNQDAPIHVSAFDGSSFGSKDAPLNLEIRNSRAVYYIAECPNDLGLARAYLQGDIASPELEPGNPYSVFKQLMELKEYTRKPKKTELAKLSATILSHGIRKPKPPEIELPSLAQRMAEGIMPHTKKGDAATVSYHYDQSNDFYAMFLGPSMTYTCACFPTADATLEKAQDHKLNMVLDKLNLKEGDSLLDIGCGWGSMEIAAAKRGIRVIGVTLSQEQVDWGTEWIAREGLEDLAEVRLMDYRDVPESGFDGICSIGMMEHVGHKHYHAYFKEMLDKLRPGGMLLNHQITRCNSFQGKRAGGFIDRYIFPDGELASPGEIEVTINNVGFEVINQENLRQHYAITLKHWNENLQDRWDDAVKLVGEPKARLWGVYMAGSRFNFELNTIQIHQFLCIKPDPETGTTTYPLRPWWNR